jgi:hypothetical protein
VIDGLPALGIRFDLDRIDSGSYGVECWRIFWQAVDPAGLDGSVLYEGDTAASMAARENAFCIAIQHMDESVLRAVKNSLMGDPRFTAVCAPPRFVEGADCTGEPLVMVGNVSGGEIVGDAWNSRPALKAVRRGRGI